jgi:hypothetical protein
MRVPAIAVLAAVVLGAGTAGAVTKLSPDPEVARGLTPNAPAQAQAPASVAYRVTALASRLPEPTDWALMILGFGGAGAALRAQRRRRATR